MCIVYGICICSEVKAKVKAGRRMSEEAANGEWVMYLDDETGAYYWYNEESGESRWAGEEEEVGGGGDVAPAGSQKDNISKKKEKKSRRRAEERDPTQQQALATAKTSKPASEGSKKKSKQRKRREYADEDDEFIDLLREQELFSRTGVDIYRYRKCFYLNLLLLEYPLLVLEGCLRTVMLSALVFSLLFTYVLLAISCSVNAASHISSYMFRAGREVLLTAAGTLSIAIPFMILFIYRDYDTENAWDLSPVPSVIGDVDARRFLMVTLGHGSEADNVDIPVDSGAKVSSTRIRAKTQDRWGGGSADNMILFPRVFLKHLLD